MAKTKRLQKPEEIEARIAALKAELIESREAERVRMRDELVSLLERSGGLADALAWARARAQERAGRKATARDSRRTKSTSQADGNGDAEA